MLKRAPQFREASKALGAAIRTRRIELKLTMQSIADAAGLSVGFISQVERGLTAPSLASLANISEVLGLPMTAFLETPEPKDMSRRSKRVSYSVPGAEVTYERISTTFPGSRLHSVILHEPPGHRSEPMSHKGEEMFFLLAGEITVEIEGHCSVLRQGDSIHFDSSRKHSTWNHSTDIASILWAGTMDVFGDKPVPIHKKTAEDADRNQPLGKEKS
ncbi:MAG: cupin domain-containing protein [Rhodobacteraceae bacterium]|nr:cupin domain-containing protein [Paracoccaceae bacterium]MCY4195862.1 cupin domain-containing protein [Paracoccaceae bacterium]MCY4327862.1 cupin domain-containing protein [Paracoccaceae bacterium]